MIVDLLSGHLKQTGWKGTPQGINSQDTTRNDELGNKNKKGPVDILIANYTKTGKG